MADLLMTKLVRELRQLPEPVNVTAEELCDALWLYQQGVGAEDSATRGASLEPATMASPAGPVESTGRAGRDQDSAVTVVLPAHVPDTPETRGSTRRIALPGSPALPKARQLSRTLRPLRYDPFKTHRANGIDEQATALHIARTGMRDIVWQVTRRRRLDLDLVLDLGGSGPIWRDLAAEIRTMLEIHGAFRSVRCWELDSDSDSLPLRFAWSAGRRGSDAVHSERVLYQTPRKPLIVVLTDGAGRSWQSRAVREPLRRWAAHGTVLLVHLLPSRMWQRTALAPLPVTFHPADDGYHRGHRLGIGNAELYEIGLDRQKDLPNATALPVIGLSPAWFRSWLPLLRGTQAGAVPGYALVVPRPTETGLGAPVAGIASVDEDHALPDPRPEERVQRFLLTASPDAIELARLLSATWLDDVSIMRKVRSVLLPGSEPEVMAEFMLGGLVFWTSSVGTMAPPDTLKLKWHEGVKQLMQDRPGGWAEFDDDRERVKRAIVADRDPAKSIDLLMAEREWVLDQIGLEPQMSMDLRLPAKYAWAATRQDDVRTPSAVANASTALPTSITGELHATSTGHDDKTTQGTTVDIGLFGSTQSGRTTFLTILAMMFADWADVRPDEQWKFVAASPSAELFVEKHESQLRATGQFPPPDNPTAPADPMLFKLERRMRRRGSTNWRRPARMADVTVSLQDRAGSQWVGDQRSPEAARYLAKSDALVYFFDPTFDDPFDPTLPDDPKKRHSADFFNAVETDLAMWVAREGRVYEGRLPQHIAVCVTKLDQQSIYKFASDSDLLETDPTNNLPWVPPGNARRLFEKIVANQGSVEGDYLLKRLKRGFHPKRTSYHALSSVGFWVPEDGEFDPDDVCNITRVLPVDSSGGEPAGRVRGPIRPVHVLDPIISVIDRATKTKGTSRS